MSEKEKINRLKVVLAEKEIQQKDFAAQLKVTPQTISRICLNESQPSSKLLKKMAILLDVEISDLILPLKKK
ncbi:MAG: XRE family transcriptional regulator [Cytophagia bacterium]|nr:XRE family transcriptional regulator [Cytophagia bacterium]